MQTGRLLPLLFVVFSPSQMTFQQLGRLKAIRTAGALERQTRTVVPPDVRSETPVCLELAIAQVARRWRHGTFANIFVDDDWLVAQFDLFQLLSESAIAALVAVGLHELVVASLGGFRAKLQLAAVAHQMLQVMMFQSVSVESDFEKFNKNYFRFTATTHRLSNVSPHRMHS